jgi:beta-phosphoglucomutase
MLQAVVFDFDGVLVNSEPLHLQAFQSTLAAHDISLSAQEYYESYVGFDDETSFRELARARHLQPDDDWVSRLVAEKTRHVKRLLAMNSPLYPGAADCVRALAARVPVAIASGALRQEILQVLSAEALSSVFTTIVAAGETARGKPAPDPYRRAVELMAHLTGTRIEPERVVGVEDSRQGLASVRAAGLRAVGLTTTFKASEIAVAELVLPQISEVTFERLSRLWPRPSEQPWMNR